MEIFLKNFSSISRKLIVSMILQHGAILLSFCGGLVVVLDLEKIKPRFDSSLSLCVFAVDIFCCVF